MIAALEKVASEGSRDLVIRSLESIRREAITGNVAQKEQQQQKQQEEEGNDDGGVGGAGAV